MPPATAWLAALGLILAGPSAQTTTPPADDVATALAAAGARAEAGDVVAQFSLGMVEYYGGPDRAAGLAWLARAADQGHAPAAFYLGQAADVGVVAPPDPEVALRWYRQAADEGFAPAARALGDAYRVGRGVAPDAAEAARWYARAARRGDLQGQYRLGQAYFDGDGVSRDYAQAYVWFARAAAQTPLDDNRRALLELRNIASVRMSPADRARAQARLDARPR